MKIEPRFKLASLFDRKKAENVPGVYFLFQRKKLCYIGYSCNVANRLRQHNSLIYSHFNFIACRDSYDAEALEFKLIAEKQPPHNRFIPNSARTERRISKKEKRERDRNKEEAAVSRAKASIARNFAEQERIRALIKKQRKQFFTHEKPNS